MTSVVRTRLFSRPVPRSFTFLWQSFVPVGGISAETILPPASEFRDWATILGDFARQSTAQRRPLYTTSQGVLW
jgi:hypothetical protein